MISLLNPVAFWFLEICDRPPQGGRTVWGNNKRGNPLRMAQILEIEDLHKSFGELEVLKGVSLTARAGDVVSLIGSSGSGKSTLLRCINMLEVPDRGTVTVDGEEVALSSEGPHRHPTDAAQLRRIRSELGMVFQSFNLWSHMTILENVMEAPLRVQKRDAAEVREQAMALLDKVGIGTKADAFRSEE